MKKILICFSLLFCLSSCAVNREIGTVPEAYDPIESVNRDIFDFNQVATKYVLNPIVEGYNWLVPGFIRNRFLHFFDNLDEGGTFVNSILQGKFENAGLTLARFAINTTIGIGGLWDVATDMGVENKDQDFGMTLETYGLAEGPIVTVPFLYPMSTRDVIGKVADIFLDPVRLVVSNILEDTSNTAYWAYYGTDMFTYYAEQKDYLEDVKNITLDPYNAMKKYSRLSRHAQFDDLPLSEMKLSSEQGVESVSYDFDFEISNENEMENVNLDIE